MSDDSDRLMSRRKKHAAKNKATESYIITSNSALVSVTEDFETGKPESVSWTVAGEDRQDNSDNELDSSDLWLAEVNLENEHNTHCSAVIKLEENQIQVRLSDAKHLNTGEECCKETEVVLSAGPVSLQSCSETSVSCRNKKCYNCDKALNQRTPKVYSPLQTVSLKTSSHSGSDTGSITNFSGEEDLFEDSLTEYQEPTESSLVINLDTAPHRSCHLHTLPQVALPKDLQESWKPCYDPFSDKESCESDDSKIKKEPAFLTSETKPISKNPENLKLLSPKANGSSLKSRLINRLLQNASTVSLAQNGLAELHQESISKAKQEASQIRREGLADGIGPFFGLPSKVQELLSVNRKITKLYDWQDECLQRPAVYQGRNLIYTLPTSGGKTLVAEILILRQLLCRKKDALLVLPYISIVQEKVRILSEFASELGFLVEEYAGSKGRFPPTKRRQKHSLFVATIEKGQSLVNSLVEAGRLDELGLVVVDELHMIGEGGSRGAAMESTLLKVLNATKESPQVIGMSATLSNLGDLAKFLNADVFSSDFRPVSLTEYVKVEDNLFRIDSKSLAPEDKLQHDKLLTFPHREDVDQMDPDHLLPLVLEIIPANSCLLFCPTKRYCENVALMLAKLICKHHRHLGNLRKKRRKALLQELRTDGGGKLCSTLAYTIPFGIAYHHSGLTSDERRLIEDAYSDGVLCLLVCTSTLAAGVNLPAKRVILRSPYVGADFIKHSQYKQMAGRAGRAGIDSSGESILISKKQDISKILDLLSGPQDVCHSSLMYSSGKGLRTLILSLIGLKMVETTQGVFVMMQKTLLAVQASVLAVDVIKAIRLALQELLDQGLVIQKRLNGDSSQLHFDGILEVDGKIHSGNLQKLSSNEKDSSSEKLLGTTKVLSVSSSESDDLHGGMDSQCSKKMRVEGETVLHPFALKQSDNLPSDSFRSYGDISFHGICNDLKLNVSEIGNATFKGSIDIECASRLYRDLKEGEQSLVLTNHLHLLYLVTPYDLAQDIIPSWMIYLQQLGTLAADELKVASLIGVRESFLVKKASGQTTRQKVDMLVVQRFYLTLILHELWKQYTVWQVAERFQQPRGFIQNLLSSAASFASCVLRFCQELPEFWAYQDLLGNFGKRLTYCVSMELIPLMEVPGIKLGRARQLHSAGYQTLQSLAAADPGHLVSRVQFLTHKAARQIICAAKVILEEKAEALMEQVEQLVPLPLPSTAIPQDNEHAT